MRYNGLFAKPTASIGRISNFRHQILPSIKLLYPEVILAAIPVATGIMSSLAGEAKLCRYLSANFICEEANQLV